MKEEPKILIEDILMPFGFRISWRVFDHVAEAKVYKAESHNDRGPLFWRDGSTHNGDPVPDITKAEIYLKIVVKWDGCSHHKADGWVHFCGPEHFKKHFDLLRYLYERAFVLMEREPDDRFDEPQELTLRTQ